MSDSVTERCPWHTAAQRYRSGLSRHAGSKNRAGTRDIESGLSRTDSQAKADLAASIRKDQVPPHCG